MMIKKTFVLTSEEGLHARPASLLAKTAMKFKCDIAMVREGDQGKVYQPKSILSILSLGASCGDRITFTLNGEDEEIAMESIENLFISFG
jgi:phosphocarrier protein HPr